jgi:hypothetical protein
MMNIRMLLTLGAAACCALPALAQNDGALAPGPKPAIKTSKDAPVAQPVPGKTSFTADQAAEHMAKRGYNLTSNPLKGDNGIWYAEGAKDNGKTVMVMMDYQGNVFEGEAYAGHPSSAPGVEPTNPPPVKPVPPSQK